MARAGPRIEELDIAVLVQPELKALRGVVDLGRDDRVGDVELWGKLVVHVEQRGAFGEALRDAVVLAADL